MKNFLKKKKKKKKELVKIIKATGKIKHDNTVPRWYIVSA